MKKLLLSLLLLFSFLYAAGAQSEKKSSIELTDINGKHYTVIGTPKGLKISGMEGKVVFLEFFGHKCPPCLKSIPHLIDLQKKHPNDLAIISIEVQGLDNAQLQAFAKQKGMNYTVISGEQERLFVSYISQRAQWQGSIPFLLVLDKQGDVQFIQAGMLPESALENVFEQLNKK